MKHVLLSLSLAAAGQAATLTFAMHQPVDPNTYFLDWTHHSGHFATDPITAFVTPRRSPLEFGYQFNVGSANNIDQGLATHPGEWDTALLGQVTSVTVDWADRIWFHRTATFRVGSLIWNETTGEFFVAYRNGPTSSPEAVFATLDPAADYCRLDVATGACSAIIGFGDGILHAGFAIEANLTGEPLGESPGAVFSRFSTTLTSVPEPQTLPLVAAGISIILIARRRTARIPAARVPAGAAGEARP